MDNEKVQYDVVWCVGDTEADALDLVKRLHPVEVSLRGLEGMRGLRVIPDNAPIPDANCRFTGARGSVVMRNFLGSVGLHAGAVIDRKGYQACELACFCSHIRVFEPGRLVGGILDMREVEEEIGDADEKQLICERETLARRRIIAMSRLEIYAIRTAARLRRMLVWPFDLAACLPVPRVCLLPFAVVGSLLSILLYLFVDIPADRICKVMASRRERRIASMLLQPFSPFSSARMAMAGAGVRTERVSRG